MILDDYKMLRAITYKEKNENDWLDRISSCLQAEEFTVDPEWAEYQDKFNKDELQFVTKLFDNTEVQELLVELQIAFSDAPIEKRDIILEGYIKKYPYYAIESIRYRFDNRWKDFSKNIIDQIKELASDVEDGYKNRETW